MEFTNDVKQVFIELLGSHEIVTVSRKYGKTPSSFEHKFIGVHNGLKWDFTPLVIDLSGCNSNPDGLAARGFLKEILANALKQLKKECFSVSDDFITNTSDFCQVFYF